MNIARRSQWQGEPLAPGVFLLDTVGELAAIYQLATLTFVGGSLVPRGGHNILEPAYFGKPVIVGPYTENFRELVSLFTRNQALTTTSPDLPESGFLELLTKPDLARIRGENGRRVVEENTGATQRALDALAVLLWMPDSLRARYSGQKP
jgi:3-deoxy-D-manno-octulosonic-acid transferase